SLGYILLLFVAMAGSYYYGTLSVQPHSIIPTTVPAVQQNQQQELGDTQPEAAKEYMFRNYDTMLVLGDSVTQRGYEVSTGG
ncbi:hypothetical protein GGF43_006513, partial [Coemansia sp. RSA 2618]